MTLRRALFFRSIAVENLMADILHRVGVKASVDQVYRAVSTREGLTGWWTRDAQGESKPGGVLRFRFSASGFDMKVIDLQPNKRVLWQVRDGPAEWIGTTVDWQLRQEDDYAIVLFKHQGGRSRWSSCTTAAPSGRSF
jgi:uncharacterized protein YndB with AHSA1/START domain